jgi:iron complex outermembrane recepter protein
VRSKRFFGPAWVGAVLALGAGIASSRAETTPDLSQLSIEDLAKVEVTSVSRRAESLRDAASSIYVISHDDIERAGARNLPEMLRLAPNLQVAQASSSRYIITARGFNGAPAAQNFSNKLLVLIDGRTVYSPLFSGVYWDMQDVPAEDVERIEVISGPGATLWGANAVNGVINVITRSARETLGAAITASGGDRERDVGIQWGGEVSERVSYRLYAKSFFAADSVVATGGKANDHWSKPQAGFRADWAASARDDLTLQGDLYRGFEAQAGAPAEKIDGANLTGRWTHATERGALEVQAYADRARRDQEVDGSGFAVNTYDAQFQHGFALGARNTVVWGGGLRQVRYTIDGTPTLLWDPPKRTLSLRNAFVQDSFALTPAVKVVAGVKLEDDPYTRPVLLPNLRVSWGPSPRLNVWSAVSRAIRSPTPFDREVVEKVGGAPFLIGASQFRSETLSALEAGVRVTPTARFSLSVATYWNDYDRLRSIEPAPAGFLPLRWGNGIEGSTYGLETWGDLQITSWWRASGSVTYQEGKFEFAPGASGLLGVSQTTNDPKYQASLSSLMTLPHDLTLDARLRYVGALPDPRLAAYTELNARLGWNVTDTVVLALTGRNLLNPNHVEYTGGNAIPRTLFVGVEWRF